MWETVRLGDVCELAYGKALATSERLEAGEVPAFGANGIKTYAKRPLFSGPSIIIGRKGSAGQITKVAQPFWPLDVTYYTKIDASRILLDFLYYTLLVLDLPSMARGVKPGINRNDLYNILILLPPLAEQKRVVERLDKAFGEIDKAIATAEAKEGEVGKLKAAMLNEDLEDLLSEKPHVCLSDVCPRVSVGHVGTTSKHYCDDGIPFIRTQNVSKYGFDDSELKYITREFHEVLKKSQIKAGDVLLTRVVIDEMRTAIVPENYGEANCANVILIRPSDDLDSQFLSLLIKSEKSQRYFMGVKKGAAQQVVNTGILKAWRLPLPSLTEQRGFVRRTLAKFRHIDKAMESIDLSAQKSSELKVAILKQELTPSEAA